MLEALAAVVEGAAEVAEVAEISELTEVYGIVLEPDIDLIQSTSLESLKDLIGDFESSFGKSELPTSIKDISDEYISTYEERLNQTPVNNGIWDGERGESKFCSDNPEANSYLKKAQVDGIEYENAIPDFSEVSKGDVEIAEMSESRPKNFRQADEQLAIQKECTPREVAEWRETNGYTWHECNDMVTCQKIPSSVNSAFGHLGGVSECKKLMMESEFDD